MRVNFSMEPLEEKFFQQETLELAQALLGCLLVNETKEGTTSGFVVETEAYMGPHDRAAHSFGNKRTKRTEIMYGKAGLVYTYAMHTHCLVNVVSGGINQPEAVLIRAIEPLIGIDLMQIRRPVKELKSLTNGPGKLTKAMGINMKDYGRSFSESPLYLAKGYDPEEIVAGKRIGIDNTGEAKDYPWRFWVKGSQFVSR